MASQTSEFQGEVQNATELALLHAPANQARQGFDGGETIAVNTKVGIRGIMEIGQDYEVTPTVSVPLVTTLALFTHFAGVTGSAALSHLRRAVDFALRNDRKAADVLAQINVVEETIAEVRRDFLARLPKQPRSGKVTAYLAFRELR